MTMMTAKTLTAGAVAGVLVLASAGTAVAAAPAWWPTGQDTYISTSTATPGASISILALYDDYVSACIPASGGDLPYRVLEYLDGSGAVLGAAVPSGLGFPDDDTIVSDYILPAGIDATTPIVGDVRLSCAHTDSTSSETLATLPLTLTTSVSPLYEFNDQWTWIAEPALEANATVTVRAMGFEPGESVTVAGELSSTPLATATADNAGAIIADFTMPSDWAATDETQLWALGASSHRYLGIWVHDAGVAPSISDMVTIGGPGAGQAFEYGMVSANLAGYTPNAQVLVALHAPLATASLPVVLGTVTADSSGNAVLKMALPEGISGAFELWAGEKSGGSGWLLSTPLEIVPIPDSAALALSASSVDERGDLEVTGAGYQPGESVELSLHSDPVVLRTVMASSTGTFQATVTLPSGVNGSHTIWATGQQSGLILRSPLSIRAAALAATGAESGPLLIISGLLLMSGLAAVGMVARRNRVAQL